MKATPIQERKAWKENQSPGCHPLRGDLHPIMELFLVGKSSNEINEINDLQQWRVEDGIREGIVKHVALDMDLQE